MKDIRIACQTITFGERQSEDFPRVFEAVSAAGYGGVEIGFRHLAKEDPHQMQRQLADAGLLLVASHVGGNLEDTPQASEERQVLDTVIDFLTHVDCTLLMYSGLRSESDEEIARDVDMLNRAAERCAAAGIQLLYHNHYWEFAQDSRTMNLLLRSAAPELGLCPDLGWIHKAGGDVLAFLGENIDRIGAVHFKDCATLEPGTDTVVYGTGCVPLRGAAEWLQANRPDLWMIAEQDHCDGDPAEAVRLNADFLRSAFGTCAAQSGAN